MTIVQHSSESNEHGTPADVIAAAHDLMGGIDLDPASCAAANARVGATHYFTQADDGLAQAWGSDPPTRVFLNPPGGALKLTPAGVWVPAHTLKGKGSGRACSSQAVWWRKLCEEWQSGDVAEAVFIGFTLEILQRSQHCGMPIQRFHRCYPRDRLEFAPLDGGDGSSPTHANVIAFLSHKPDAFQRFVFAFNEIGFCEPGYVL